MTRNGAFLLGYLRRQHSGTTAETIARDLGMPVSEVLENLLELERRGLVEARQTGAWSIGWRLQAAGPAGETYAQSA